MITEVNVAEFAQNAGELLNQVSGSGSVVISRDGTPVAVLVDAELFARMQQMQWEQFDKIRNRIADAYANVPEEVGLAEIDALVADERRRQRQ
ncbi:prevent-host-death family protein [Bryocella elongata]|uniref:Antitoxin n=1 Tax=Bryocella elongata TaxID=863522 RepID=A0A1H5ZA39_9BACT|nr:type II toxin-antitoxin system prevent-host-death family antitoxin [Bryocella elongata]SEG32595.1 prevent-host-death family protein [Bryocella elongata]